MSSHSRLTTELTFPLDTFKRCQLCGFVSDDTCSFRMWQECDDKDAPEPGNVFILCRADANPTGSCQQRLDDHPRLYREVPWGQGAPGHLMLLCGDCPYRKGTGCAHPNLKANGGEGLLIEVSSPLVSHVHVCTVDDNGEHHCIPNPFPTPALACEGHPTRKPTGAEGG